MKKIFTKLFKKKELSLTEESDEVKKEQAKKRIEELRKQTEYYAQKYYDEDKPEIADFEYDMLML